MSDLIVITGPPASGKAAIGTSLAGLTGFRLFHNHMTAEPAGALFGWGTPQFMQAAGEIRLSLLSRAVSQPDVPTVIFTFVWAFDLADDNRFMAQLVDLYESKRRRVYFVELRASVEARVAREGTPLRLSLKPAKHDVERARALHAQVDSMHRMNSNGDFPYPDQHLVIETEDQPPAESALMIARHFGFSQVTNPAIFGE